MTENDTQAQIWGYVSQDKYSTVLHSGLKSAQAYIDIAIDTEVNLE